jgi:hypothetical protein
MSRIIDQPPVPIWQYSQSQLSFLVGRLARIARKPFGEDHLCLCGHPVSHHRGSEKCAHWASCGCEKIRNSNADHGCDCGVCIAKDAFEQAKQLP